MSVLYPSDERTLLTLILVPPALGHPLCVEDVSSLQYRALNTLLTLTTTFLCFGVQSETETETETEANSNSNTNTNTSNYNHHYCNGQD